MLIKKSIGKVVVVSLMAAVLVIGVEAGKADAVMQMDRNELVQVTEQVLNEQTVMQMLSTEVTAQARKCGDAVKGGLEVEPAAEGKAQALLDAKEVTLRDTKVIGAISRSGWDEEWLWASAKGKSCRMRINFATTPGAGTVWSIKSP